MQCCYSLVANDIHELMGAVTSIIGQEINIWSISSQPPTSTSHMLFDLCPSPLSAVAPEIQISPESVDILNRSTAVLLCAASGDPSPMISWEHNGVTVDTDDARVTVLPNGTLIIAMVMMSDMGDYQCFATNALGTVESDVVLLMVEGRS